MSKKVWALIALFVLVGGLMTACGGQQVVEVTRVVTETEVVEQEPEVVEVEVTSAPVEVEVTRVVEVEVEPVNEEEATRKGGWLDTIVVIQEPDSNAAVARLEAGDMQMYADDIGGEAALQAVASENIETRTQYGLFDELLFNIGTCSDATMLNPFANQTIRQAMNFAMDRNYVAQELYQGLAVPKYTTIAEASADRARFAKEIRLEEAKWGYDLEKARGIITTEMEGMGATMDGGVWSFEGKPINIIFLIRNEDTRLLIGGYVATQLEELGFQVERVERRSAELSPLWIESDPTACSWHLYTGAWSQTAIDRESNSSFEQYYTNRLLPWPLWALYAPVPELDEAAQIIYNGSFESLDQRNELFRTAIPLSNEYATRDWITSRTTVVPFRNEVSVTTDLAGGVSGAPMWSKTIRYEDKVGGSMNIGLPSVFTEPWNPIGGSNWVFDMMVIRGVGDAGVYPNPNTGLNFPNRIERAELTVREGYPMAVSSDWVTLAFEPEVTVPDDAWAGWDAENQVFLTAAEVYTETQTALVKSTVYYPADLYTTVTWHDGSPISVADFIMGMITSFDLGDPASANYDESLVPNREQFLAAFRGVRIASVDPLVIETWSEAGSLDAENAVTTWWPNYDYGDAAWHNMALMLRGDANGGFAFTPDKATAAEIERINLVAGPSLEVLAGELISATAEAYVPYAPTLGQYVTAEDATARYTNLAEFARRYGHYYISTGSYFLSGVFPVEGQAVMSNYAAHPDFANRFAGFSAPAFPVTEIDGPARVTIGQEASFDIFIDVFDGPYPAADIEAVNYLVFGADGSLVAEGVAENVEDGVWNAVLGADVTGGLAEGANRLDVVVVSKLVAIPGLSSYEFVTAP